MNSTSEISSTDSCGKPFPKNLMQLLADRKVSVSELHEYCMFALRQCLAHGNTGFALRLLDMLGGQSPTKRKVAAWFCNFGNFKVREGRLEFRKRSDIKNSDPVDWLTKANAAPFYSVRLALPKGTRLFVKKVGVAKKKSDLESKRSTSVYTISGGLPSLGRRR